MKPRVAHRGEEGPADIPGLLDTLLVDPARVAEINDADSLSAVQGEIASRQIRLASLQAALAGVRPVRQSRATGYKMLTPEETAARLGTTVQWLYKNWKVKLPFGVKVSPKQLRFSERKIERFLAMREAA